MTAQYQFYRLLICFSESCTVYFFIPNTDNKCTIFPGIIQFSHSQEIVTSENVEKIQIHDVPMLDIISILYNQGI